MPKLPVEQCCGCTACSSICPKSAIAMQPNAEGFSCPVVDPEMCVSCGLCEKACPILCKPAVSDTYTRCVVARNTSDEVLEESTSGGFIDALIAHVLCTENGYAAGVAYNENFLPVHTITSVYEDAAAFRNSKYAQSYLGDTFIRIKALLTEGGKGDLCRYALSGCGIKILLEKRV